MANFNTTDLGVASGSPFRAQAPVVDNTPSLVLNAVSQATQLAFDVAESKQVGEANAVVESFTSDQLRLAEAVSQGKLTSSQARSRMRAVYDSYRANNPGLSEALLERQKDIVSTAGLGKVVTEESPQEKAFNSLAQEAMTSGYVPTGATGEALQEGVRNYAALLRGRDELNDAKANLDYAKSQVGLEQSQIELAETRAQEAQKKALSSMAASYSVKFNNDMMDVASRVQTGEITQQDATLELQNRWASLNSMVSQTGDRLSGQHLANLMKPMEMMYNNTLGLISGSTTADVVENQNRKEIALASQAWLSNPKMASIVAGDNLLRNSSILSFIKNVDEDILNHIKNISKKGGKGTNLVPSDPEEMQGVDTLFRILDDNMTNAMGKGLPNDQAKDQLDTSLVNAVKSVKSYEAFAESPKDFHRVMDFFASPNFGKYTKAYGGIPAEIAQDALETLQVSYENEVLPAVKESWEEARFGGRAPVGLSARYHTARTTGPEVIIPTLTGSGIVFKAAEGADPRDGAIKARIKNLNKKVAPVINRLIRASSHLSVQDYRKVYETNYAYIFGQDPDSESGGDDPGKKVDVSSVIGNVADRLFEREGTGDTVTNVETGEVGVTQAARDAVNATEEDTDKDVAVKYLKHLDKSWGSVEGYSDVSDDLKGALLDASYNMGESVMKQPKLIDALREGDEEGVVYELLDTAQVGGKSLKGLAKRRAEVYNEVAEVKITKVEQKADGTIIYYAGDDIVREYTPRGGRHAKSSAGTITLSNSL